MEDQDGSGIPSSAPGMTLPQGLAVGGQDEALKNLMMSWYYAGYYTGFYEGQKSKIREQKSGQKKG